MVVRNKVYRAIDTFRSLLVYRGKKSNHKMVVRGNRSKNRILDFYLKNDRWPSRQSEKKIERSLGQRFENYCSKEAPGYDADFRRLALALGRSTNKKRKHNKKAFKQQILDFIAEHGRIPNRYKQETIPGEGNLHAKLTYYTTVNKDMSFLGKVYDGDLCHRSAIPFKFRKLINEQLDELRIETPLIRQV